MGKYEEQIIPIKIAHLAEYVSRKKRISLDEALTYIYSNDMYKELYNEGAKWWYLSSEALYEEYGADEFLLKHYDLLHTQGTGYVIDEVQRFISRRKKK